MKKAAKRAEPVMLPHYDFRGGTRGKYAARVAGGSNVVVLDPDVAGFFPNSESVSEALRMLARIARGTAGARAVRGKKRTK